MHLRSASQPSPTLVNTFSHFSRRILIATTSLSSNLHRLDPTTTKYTLIMADPDAPNSQTPILAPFLHWIVSDVQPDCVPGQVRISLSSLPSSFKRKKKRTHLKTNPPSFSSPSRNVSQSPHTCSPPLSPSRLISTHFSSIANRATTFHLQCCRIYLVCERDFLCRIMSSRII